MSLQYPVWNNAFFFFLRCNFYIVIWANLMSDLLNIDTPFVDKMM